MHCHHSASVIQQSWVVVQFVGKAAAAAQRLAAAQKTGQELQMLKMTGDSVAKNKQHQQQYEQLQV